MPPTVRELLDRAATGETVVIPPCDWVKELQVSEELLIWDDD